EGIEVYIEDMEPEQSMLPHLGKCRKETPLASDESSSLRERRVFDVYLNPPSDQFLVISLPNLEICITNLVGIGGSNKLAPK
ncbi:hypothetical protein KI387_043378, partial [Taxus chinensis]